MQDELDQAEGGVSARILAVNQAGYEDDFALMASGRDLPLLQDTPAENVWMRWNVTWRDVIVLDRQGRFFGVYNLTAHDLRDPRHRADLRAMIRAAAHASTPPRMNEH